MPRLSTLSNPTGLIDLDKSRVRILVDDQGAKAAYSVLSLNLADASISPTARMIVIAARGNSEVRSDHGIVADWNKGFVDISEMGAEGAWTFRVLFIENGSPRLIAAIENVRPEGLGNSESLIALEAADLGEVPWEMVILEQDGRGVIRFNRNIYATSALAEADYFFSCLVIPEAVRQLASYLMRDPGRLDEAQWEPFRRWLAIHEITEWPEDAEPIELAEDWCREVVAAFCRRHKISTTLSDKRAEGEH